MKKVLCVGDSLTFGSVGYSYVRFLGGVEAVNRGLNGDCLLGMEPSVEADTLVSTL